MRLKLTAAVLAAFVSILPVAAIATDNTAVTERGGGGSWYRSTDIGSLVKIPWHTLSNTAGVNALTAAGTSASTLLTIQGHISGVALPVSGTFWQATQPVSGTITCGNCSGSGVSAADKAAFTSGTTLFAATGGMYQTTATANPLVSGEQGAVQLTINRAMHVNLRDATGGVVSPLTDTQLRATALSVSGTVTANLGTIGTVATEATLAAASAKLPASLGVKADTASLSVTNSTQDVAAIGIVTETAPVSDIASSGLNGRLQRVAQNISAVTGSKAPGTAAVSALLAGGVYNTTPPTLTNGQQASLQFDANGQLKISGAISGAGDASAANQTSVQAPVAPGTATSTKSLVIGGRYDSTQKTLTNGQEASFAMSARGALMVATGADAFAVNCSNCSGSGLAQTDTTTFTATTSGMVSAGGFFQTTATNNPLATGQMGAVQLTANRAMHVNLRNTVGVAISPLTDTELRATAVPVSIATIPTHAVTVASGGIAAGAMVDIGAQSASAYAGSGDTTVIGALKGLYSVMTGDIPSVTGPLAAATAVATKALQVGGQYLSTQPTMTNTQQAGLLFSARGELLVAAGVSGQVPGTGATNLGKAEDAPHTSGDVGVMALCVRNDTNGTPLAAAADYIPCTTAPDGSIRMTITNGANGVPITSFGGGTQFAEDAAHTTGDLGTMSLAVRTDTPAALATTTGDYIPLTTDNLGALWVNDSKLNTATGAINAAVYAGTGDATVVGILKGIYAAIIAPVPNVEGPLAAATAVATKALVIGGQYLATQPTMTNTQQAAALFSARGELLVAPGVSGFAAKVDQTTPNTTNLISQGQTVTAANVTTPIIGCQFVAKYDASTNGSTQIVALSSTQTIRICGYTIRTGAAAANVKLVSGTGTNCGTGPSDITPAWQLLANDGQVDRSPNWQGLATVVSEALCINSTAAVAVQALVYYNKY